jgi:broad specificity phosphatase PhoE
MIHFILIRHGETDWTKQRRYQGRFDTSLNVNGRRQIQRFVKEITRYRPDLIFSSQLARSKESAAILCAPLKKRPKVDARLNELSFGQWEGKTAGELIEANDPVYDQWMKRKIITPQGGESIRSLQKRVRSFIRDCVRKYNNKKIIIVTHGGPIRIFLAQLLNLPHEAMFQFRIDPGTITILGRYDYSSQLILLNSISPKPGVVPEGCC